MAVRRFCHFVEDRDFAIMPDHKPFVHASRNLRSDGGAHPQRELHQVFRIAELTSDICHISGRDNVVAGALSRAKIGELAFSTVVEFMEMASALETDSELQDMRDAPG